MHVDCNLMFVVEPSNGPISAMVSKARKEEAAFLLKFYLLRERFIADAPYKTPHVLPQDFKMATYLIKVCCEMVAEIIELDGPTWMFLWFFLFCVFQVMAFTTVSDLALICFGWVLLGIMADT